MSLNSTWNYGGFCNEVPCIDLAWVFVVYTWPEISDIESCATYIQAVTQ